MTNTIAHQLPAVYHDAVSTVLKQYPLVQDIIHALAQRAASPLLVGGAVRDVLLGLPIKDLDIEVHGITLQQLEQVLAQFGTVLQVGKAYGVLRIAHLDIDWSVPRSDFAGRKPQVTLDPNIDMVQSFARRDLTMNAMGINLLTWQLIDPFGGWDDLRNKILRAPDPKLFVQDPLRLFRVMQFIGRFEMEPDAQLNELCAQMPLADISKERIEMEFVKLFLKSRYPSRAIRWLRSINRLDQILPEVAALIAVPQNPQWHPEGDVFEHTMQALDAAAVQEYPDEQKKLIIMYGALCHDLGKAVTTQFSDGAWHSYGHAAAGVSLTKKLLKRICTRNDIQITVPILVYYHMQPLELIASKASDAAYRRLARKLHPYATMYDLYLLMCADRQGRNPDASQPLTGPVPDAQHFLARAQHAAVVNRAQEPVLHGRDLLEWVSPGLQLGQLLKQAYEIQLDEGITDKDELKKRVLAGFFAAQKHRS